MKIQTIPNTNYEANPNQRNLAGKPANTSFKGLGQIGKDIASGTFRMTEKGGFFLEFLIVDSLSLILPRIIIGLNRDKDKIGHLNYQAGAEEAGRELLSGPSMNLIPMAMASFAVRKLMPAIKINKDTFEGINESFKNVINKNTGISDKSQLTRKLAEQVFDDSFGTEELKGYRARFVDTLEKATQSKPRLALVRKFANSKLFGKTPKPDAFDDAEKAFNDLVFEMNNKAAKGMAPLDSYAIGLKKLDAEGKIENAPTSSKTFFEDFHNYTKDSRGMVEKFIKKDAAQSVEEFFKKASSNVKKGKIGLAALAFFVVGGFLLYLPKVYQIGKVSPAAQSAKRAQDSVEKEGGAK